jgi:hypothetical protein
MSSSWTTLDRTRIWLWIAAAYLPVILTSLWATSSCRLPTQPPVG